MLDALHKPTSYDGRDSLSQPVLALKRYLETDYWGNTPWSGLPYPNGQPDHPMPESLNFWIGGSYLTGYYEADGLGMPTPAPDLATYKSDLRWDINNGWPLTANIHEPPNTTPRMQGHPPGEDIWHWLAIYGYLGSTTTGGDTTLYADSATTVWASVLPKASQPSSDIVYLYREHGLVW
jgi:hypothetical protein